MALKKSGTLKQLYTQDTGIIYDYSGGTYNSGGSSHTYGYFTQARNAAQTKADIRLYFKSSLSESGTQYYLYSVELTSMGLSCSRDTGTLSGYFGTSGSKTATGSWPASDYNPGDDSDTRSVQVWTGSINKTYDVLSGGNSAYLYWVGSLNSGWDNAKVATVYIDQLYFNIKYGFKVATGQNNTKAGSVVSDDLTTIFENTTRVALAYSKNPGYKFKGWSKSLNGSIIQTDPADRPNPSDPTSIYADVDGKTTYYAITEPIQYSIQFLPGVDATISDPNNILDDKEFYIKYYNIESGTLNFSTVSAVRLHYNFDGWRKNGTSTTPTKTLSIDSNIIEDRLYDAVFSPTQYTITYENIEGSNCKSSDIDTIEKSTTLPIPDKPGYEFLGWKLNGEGTSQINITIPVGETGHKTYVADFKLRPPVNIIYELDGGVFKQTSDKNHPASFTKETVGDEGLLLDEPYKAGYSFVGWLEKRAGKEQSTDTVKNVIINITNNEDDLLDRTYTAVYTDAESYNITYKDQWGNELLSLNNPTSLTIVSGKQALKNPSRIGYRFNKWVGTCNGKTFDVEVTGEISYIEITAETVGNHIYTAYFDLIPYTFSYEYNWKGIEGNLPSGAKENPKTFNIETEPYTLINPEIPGYTFSHWTEKINGIETSNSQEVIILDIDESNTGNRQYIANYTPITYNIYYEDEWGNSLNVEGNPVSITRDSITVTLINPSKTGYNFDGWEEIIGEKSIRNNKNMDVVIKDSSGIGVRKYIAYFTPIDYVFSYEYNWKGIEGNLSSGAEENPKIFNIETNSFALNNPIIPGYNFSHWTEKINGEIVSDSKDTIVLDIDETNVGNRQYIANYTPIIYSVSYKDEWENDLIITGNPIQISRDSDEVTLINPTKTGYDFNGWTETKLGLQSTPNEATIITVTESTLGDRKYVANFTAIDYSFSYSYDWKGVSGHLPEGAQENPRVFNIEDDDYTLTNPQVPGYNFSHWTDQDNNNLGDTVVLSMNEDTVGPRTYKANYTPIIYNISYEDEWGHALAIEGNHTTTNMDSDSFILANPTKTGYDFDGWTEVLLNIQSTPSKITTVKVTESTIGNRKYVANFTAIDYPFTYNYTWKIDEDSIDTIGALPEGAEPNPSYFNIEDTSSQLIEPEAEHFTFDGWIETIKVNEEVVSKKEVGKSYYIKINENTIGSREYQATYSPINQSITYIHDSIHNGNAISNRDKLRKYYTKNKAYSLLQSDSGEDTIPERAGYEFTGFELVNSSTDKTPIEVIPAGSSGEKIINITFKPIPQGLRSSSLLKLADGTYTSIFPEGDKPQITFKNTTWGLESENGQLEVEYQDNFYFQRILTYRDKKYEFLGWKHKRDALDYLENTDSVLLSSEAENNNYIAIFQHIEYSIDILMNQNTRGIFGDVLVSTERGRVVEKIPENKVSIEGLYFDDTCKISIIPHAADNNSRYFLNKWSTDSTDSVLTVKVDSNEWARAPQQTVKTIHVDFDLIDLINSVQSEQDDKDYLNLLFNKEITQFILQNQIESLGNYAFYNCGELKYVYMPGVKSLGNHAFENCSKLKNVIISAQNKNNAGIGLDTFKNCKNLNTLILPGEFIPLNQLFSNADNSAENSKDWSLFKQKLGKIYVNPGRYDDSRTYVQYYKDATNWNIYADIIEPITDKIYIE